MSDGSVEIAHKLPVMKCYKIQLLFGTTVEVTLGEEKSDKNWIFELPLGQKHGFEVGGEYQIVVNKCVKVNDDNDEEWLEELQKLSGVQNGASNSKRPHEVLE